MIKITLIIMALFSAMNSHPLEVDLKNTNLYNPTAFISSQCYTKTYDDKGNKHNPCYSCHTKAKEPNYFSDEDLQKSYSFPEFALENRWTNSFKDRSLEVEKISNKEILEYIRLDNYKDEDNKIILQKKLNNIPKNWDFNNNGKWDGFIPDLNYDFDERGFDRKENGEISGWRAFSYYPFLGTFWPTNGSTDDVIIRLAEVFWKDTNGNIDLNIYNDNLEIVEKLIKQEISNLPNNYVGLASIKDLKIAPGFYPVGTEFLHSVRYIDYDENTKVIKLSKRIKELRYAKKHFWTTYNLHKNLADEEIKENDSFPDRYSIYLGDIENGLSNKRGWSYQGFIEDNKGDLRPQSYEETLFCMGCHSSIGAISDSTFSFARKITNNSYKNGWYHWSKKDLRNIIDKNDEYLRYLKNNNHGNEFRNNDELYNKFFKNGKLNQNEIKKIKDDISYLLTPSKERALELNKAYKVIVNEQSYIYGRDPHIKPLNNIFKVVKEEQSTELKIIEKH